MEKQKDFPRYRLNIGAGTENWRIASLLCPFSLPGEKKSLNGLVNLLGIIRNFWGSFYSFNLSQYKDLPWTWKILFLSDHSPCLLMYWGFWCF